MHRRLVCFLSAALMSAALGFPVRGAETTATFREIPPSFGNWAAEETSAIRRIGEQVREHCRISEGQAEWIASTGNPIQAGVRSASQNTDFPRVKSSISPLWTAMGICLLTVVVMTWLESREK